MLGAPQKTDRAEFRIVPGDSGKPGTLFRRAYFLLSNEDCE